MLKVRAALEKKLKQKGIFNSITPRTDIPQKLLKPLNGYHFALIFPYLTHASIVRTNSTNLELNRKLESYDDFDDDPVNVEGANHGHASSLSARKVAQLVAANRNKSKV